MFHKTLAIGRSTAEEHLPLHLKVEGSSPTATAGTGRDEEGEKKYYNGSYQM
jgi:hypothetical protein